MEQKNKITTNYETPQITQWLLGFCSFSNPHAPSEPYQGPGAQFAVQHADPKIMGENSCPVADQVWRTAGAYSA